MKKSVDNFNICKCIDVEDFSTQKSATKSKVCPQKCNLITCKIYQKKIISQSPKKVKWPQRKYLLSPNKKKNKSEVGKKSSQILFGQEIERSRENKKSKGLNRPEFRGRKQFPQWNTSDQVADHYEFLIEDIQAGRKETLWRILKNNKDSSMLQTIQNSLRVEGMIMVNSSNVRVRQKQRQVKNKSFCSIRMTKKCLKFK